MADQPAADMWQPLVLVIFRSRHINGINVCCVQWLFHVTVVYIYTLTIYIYIYIHIVIVNVIVIVIQPVHVGNGN